MENVIFPPTMKVSIQHEAIKIATTAVTSLIEESEGEYKSIWGVVICDKNSLLIIYYFSII